MVSSAEHEKSFITSGHVVTDGFILFYLFIVWLRRMDTSCRLLLMINELELLKLDYLLIFDNNF